MVGKEEKAWVGKGGPGGRRGGGETGGKGRPEESRLQQGLLPEEAGEAAEEGRGGSRWEEACRRRAGAWPTGVCPGSP